MHRNTLLAATLLAAFPSVSHAEGWSFAVGASGSTGDSLSREILSTTIRKDLSWGAWEISPFISWDLGREGPSDSLWAQVYPEISVERGLGDQASLLVDGWFAPLSSPLDGGGSTELAAWIDPANWARISGRIGGGWSASAQASAWTGIGLRWIPEKELRWSVDASVEYGQPSLSANGGGKSAGMYVPVFTLSSGIEWTAGSISAGPDARWSWYSFEKSSGKGMGRMSGTSFSGSHDDWTLGGHLGWIATEHLELSIRSSWTWTDDHSTTTVASGIDRASGRMGASPAGNAQVPAGLSWGADSRWNW
jgi:hypothetical protein